MSEASKFVCFVMNVSLHQLLIHTEKQILSFFLTHKIDLV